VRWLCLGVDEVFKLGRRETCIADEYSAGKGFWDFSKKSKLRNWAAELPRDGEHN
jgi:hypothetical protein